MITQSPKSQDLVAHELQRFLESSQLSLSGLAKKLNVSKAQLSLIKNSKKTPSLDIGLKILKYVGIDQTVRRDWALSHLAEFSDEYEELENSVRQELQKVKHSQDICNRFENNLSLMNIYLDIVNAENGITLYAIEKNYGKESLALIKALVSSGLIEQKKDTLHTNDTRSVLTKRSSFNFMKTIFDDQKDKFDSGNWDGRFQFIMDDVNEEGQEKLQELLKRTMKEAAEIIKNHEKPRSKGGKRMIFQVLSGMVKGPMLSLVFALLTSFNTFAGGVEGGSSLRMRLVNDESKEQLVQQVNEIYEKVNSPQWNNIKERAYDYCKDRYKSVNKNRISLKVTSVQYDRFWIERREHQEAFANISFSCR